MGPNILPELTDSSAACMRAVAAALRGEHFQNYPATPLKAALAGLVSSFGQRTACWVVERVISRGGQDPALAKHLTTENLARWAVSLYTELKGPWEAVILGAPNGGVAHLATALGAPFLSQHFLFSFRHHAHADDIATYRAHGDALAAPILARNPDLAVVNHYDPLHDRFLVKYVNHIRVKLLGLPMAYQEFIHTHLRPGGTLVFIDCRYPWHQYRLGERHTFQVGGLGGVRDLEFIAGRAEIEAMQQAERSPFVGGWRLDEPLEVGPESEWGTLPPFRQAVEAFAAASGYRFLALEGDSPEWFSGLAFSAHRWLSEKEGRPPQGVLIDCFTQTDPAACRQSRLWPLWLPFNCTDSLAFLQRWRHVFPPVPLLFAPVPNFAPAFDTVPLVEWLAALEGLQVQVLGVDQRHYPADLAGLFRFRPQMEAWCQAHPDPVRARLNMDELSALAAGQADRLENAFGQEQPS